MNDKPEGRGMERLRGKLPDPTQEPQEPMPSDDSWESPTGDGRNSRHGVLCCQLIKGKSIIGIIPYHSVQWAEGDYNGTVFKIQFFRGEALYEVTIQGSQTGLQQVVDRITAGKRESIRCNSETILDIQIEEIKSQTTNNSPVPRS